ncbi:hypothetical protein GGR55DRAFT_246313 [Xylaria sp. FL0064]|nr:hypothetical protein GGR55DRAFT_246313 [Xylaria sp. FL0064]
MVQSCRGLGPVQSSGAVCGLLRVLRYFGTWILRYWIRHDGSDFWVGVLLALLAGILTGGPPGRVQRYQGTRVQLCEGSSMQVLFCVAIHTIAVWVVACL